MAISSVSKIMEVNLGKQKREEFCVRLVNDMTLEEKVGQMVQADLSWNQDVKQLIRQGRIGSLLTILEPKLINEHQLIAINESRLKIPLLIGNDIVHGYRTIFPIPLALACTWDTDLIEMIAVKTMSEAVPSGTTWNFAPMVDICRDPRWGRVAESAGEDPILTSKIGQAWVRGFQKWKDENGRSAAACVKHFAAYGGVEAGRDYNSVDMSERRLREEYLPSYRAAIEAGARSIMTSFNDLNGLPASANPFLLKQILRNEWTFDGVILSDYDSIGELVLHGFTHDHKEAALRSALAGVDIDMMGNAYHFHLADLVREGKVPEKYIDESALRVLRLKYDLGLFENPYIEIPETCSFLLQKSTLDLALKSAEESIVLLKNEGGFLPIDPNSKTIGLIGPFVDERKSMLGCWSFNGRESEVMTLREAFENTLPATTRLLVEKGCDIESPNCDFAAAVSTANHSDVIILALGESDNMSGEAHSRAHLNLPGQQQALLDTLIGCGKPVIALLFSGRPLAIPDLVSKVSSVLYVWHGGTQSAQAAANIVLGLANPSGKLPITFPRSVGQIPIYYNHKSTGRPIDSKGTIQFNEAHKSSYIDESNSPLFPFGYGLSYTTFDYKDLEISKSVLEVTDTLKISAIVSNSGSVKGSEIVQLYIQDLVGSVTRPVKELKDFKKLTLEPGESQCVEFTISTSDLSFLGPDLQPTIEPGRYKVWIAPNSNDGLMGQFMIG